MKGWEKSEKKGVQVAEKLQMQKKKAWMRIDHTLRESTSCCVDASSVQQLFSQRIID